MFCFVAFRLMLQKVKTMLCFDVFIVLLSEIRLVDALQALCPSFPLQPWAACSESRSAGSQLRIFGARKELGCLLVENYSNSCQV